MNQKSNYTIYETTNYEQFVKLLGNRDVKPSRLSAIKESILRVGYRPSPILVNEKKEVIDGQGRLMACKDLNLPILFIEEPGLTIEDCISMNIKMKNWDESDYINCYARKGVQDYLNLEEMMHEFPALNWQQINEISHHNSGKAKDDLKNGNLKFETYTYTEYERARWISAMLPIIKESRLNTNRAVEVLIRLDKYKLVDKKRMLDSIEKYSRANEFASYRSLDTLSVLNDIYNYNRRQKKYFTDSYKEIADKRRGCEKH